MQTEAKRRRRGRPAEPTERSRQIMAYVQELLCTGPKSSKELWGLVRARFGEHALHNYKRARTRLKVIASRQGYGKGGKWIASLPNCHPNT